MRNRNITERDIKVIRRLLGDDVANEFLDFLRERNGAKAGRNGSRRAVRVNTRNREKEFVVDVSNFKERDLQGWLEYDECYFEDEFFWKPKWLEKLERVCSENKKQKYVVVFKGIENASDKIYNILKSFKETGEIFDEEYDQKLPSNARFGEVELPERCLRTTSKDKNESHDNIRGSYIDYNEYDVLR